MVFVSNAHLDNLDDHQHDCVRQLSRLPKVAYVYSLLAVYTRCYTNYRSLACRKIHWLYLRMVPLSQVMDHSWVSFRSPGIKFTFASHQGIKPQLPLGWFFGCKKINGFVVGTEKTTSTSQRLFLVPLIGGR